LSFVARFKCHLTHIGVTQISSGCNCIGRDQEASLGLLGITSPVAAGVLGATVPFTRVPTTKQNLELTTSVPDMEEIRSTLEAMAQHQTQLLAAFDNMSKRVSNLESASKAAGADAAHNEAIALASSATLTSSGSPSLLPADAGSASPTPPAVKSGFTSRIILTTYPKQIGINPLPMDWGAADPAQRGPVTVSRNSSTIRRRNAIGAHGGSYSIYYALALASKQLNPDHRPDFTNTEPAVNIGPFSQWADKKKIVAMDPWGHLVPWTFKDLIDKEHSMAVSCFFSSRHIS
jgi:hypothetical protein